MLQLKNLTPFAADIAVFPNEQGIEALYTIVKASFIFNGNWTLADQQVPPQDADEYLGEPGLSSISIGSDFQTCKLNSDIVMVGDAIAPNNQQTTAMRVKLSVGKVSQSVQVFGDRIWDDGRITSPQPFVSMPMIYERAFGGRHQLDSDNYLAEERNPVGCGFAGKRTRQEMDGLPLPNIEFPEQLVSKIGDNPSPAGFGVCGPEWLPRREFSGSYDEEWHTHRAPYLPLDFDRRFYNVAHPKLIYPGFLQGGESIQIIGMNAAGELNFQLPIINLVCEATVAGELKLSEFNIETLILAPNEKQISIIWKAQLLCDKSLLEIEQVELKLSNRSSVKLRES